MKLGKLIESKFEDIKDDAYKLISLNNLDSVLQMIRDNLEEIEDDEIENKFDQLMQLIYNKRLDLIEKEIADVIKK